MKFLIVIVLALFPSVACANGFNALHKKAADTVVMVWNPANDNGGGGVLVAPQTVLTVRHGFENAKEVIVSFRNGKTIKGLVMAEDETNDLARVVLSEPFPHPSATINFQALEVGEDIFVVGHPNALGWSLSRGYVMYVERRLKMDGDTEASQLIQFDASVYPGSSGGGVFNLRGELVAIVKGALVSTEIMYAIPSTSFCKRVLKCQTK